MQEYIHTTNKTNKWLKMCLNRPMRQWLNTTKTVLQYIKVRWAHTEPLAKYTMFWGANLVQLHTKQWYKQYIWQHNKQQQNIIQPTTFKQQQTITSDTRPKRQTGCSQQYSPQSILIFLNYMSFLLFYYQCNLCDPYNHYF